MTLTVDEARQSGPQREEALGYAWRKGRGAVLRGCSVGMAWEATVVVVPFLAQRAIDEGLVRTSSAYARLWGQVHDGS